jgi:hypothetical protein
MVAKKILGRNLTIKLSNYQTLITQKMEKPTWLIEANIKQTLDAREIIASGGHPLEQVLNDISEFKVGEIYELITPFSPAPLIEKVKNLGFEAYSEQDGSGIVKNYFRKK